MKTIVKNLSKIGWILLIVFPFFAACVSEPETKTAPEWIKQARSEDAQYIYLVESGSNAQGDKAAAEQNAVQSLIDALMREIGVEIEAVSKSEAAGSLDEITTSINAAVTQKGEMRMTGFSVMERWHTSQANGTVLVYVKARYSKEDLEKRKKEFEKYIREKDEAISVPEREGDDYVFEGRLFDAVRRYIDAAAAASVSDVRNADIHFKRNIDKARDALASVSLIKVTDNLETESGKPFTRPFKLKLTGGTTEDSPGIPGVDITIAYKIANSSGKLRSRFQEVKTDEEGMVEFDHPVPQVSGPGEIIMQMNLSPVLEPLENVPSKFSELVSSIEQIAADKRAVFSYQVGSGADIGKACIIILDLDKNRRPRGSSRSMDGVVSVLSRNGMDVSVLNIDPVILKDKSDRDILNTVKKMSAGKYDSCIFGVLEISEIGEVSGRITAKAVGSIKVADLKEGRILFSEDKFKRSAASSENRAVDSAFYDLGQLLAKSIMSNLR